MFVKTEDLIVWQICILSWINLFLYYLFFCTILHSCCFFQSLIRLVGLPFRFPISIRNRFCSAILLDGQVVLSLFHQECFPDGCKLFFTVFPSKTMFSIIHCDASFFHESHDNQRPWCMNLEECLIFAMVLKQLLLKAHNKTKRRRSNHGWEIVIQIFLLQGRKKR